MNTENPAIIPFPEVHLFPRLERVADALKHLVFRYPDEPFAKHGDHFIPKPQEP